MTDQRGGVDETILKVYVLGRYTGELGLSDLAVFVEQLFNDDCGVCGGTDLDGDSDVDMDDWARFAGSWLE